jgi:hypothetical protein
MALFNLVMLICSIRTNIIFVLVFVCLEGALIFVATSNFYGAVANFDNYHMYRKVRGIFSGALS